MMLRRGCACLVSGSTTATAAAHTPIASTSTRVLTSVHLPHLTPPLPTRRGFHATPSTHFPRYPRGSKVKRWSDDDEIEAIKEEVSDVDAGAEAKPNSKSGNGNPDIPWFLEQEEVIIEDADADRDHSSGAADSPLGDSSPTTPPLPADLPETLRLMHRHLTLGPVAGLLHKPSFDEDDKALTYPSLEFINCKNTKNIVNWCDWIVFVTVRENNGGNINARVSEDVSEILKRAGPPTAEELGDDDADGNDNGGPVDLDDLLGPSQQLSGTRSPYGPRSKQRVDPDKLEKMKEDWQAMQAQEAEKAEYLRLKNAPAWARHREALKKKFATSKQGTTNWRPHKILSRETQSGMRILHKSDPVTYSLEALAAQFKISPEAARRILKARPAAWGGDSMEDKGARRYDPETGHLMVQTGPERWAREDEEIERLRNKLGMRLEDNLSAVEGEMAQNEEDGRLDEREEEEDEDEEDDEYPDEDDMDVPPPTGQVPLLELRALGKPRHPVRIEGGPLSSLANKTRNKRIAKRATFGGGTLNDGSQGDAVGEWILVDAGWCVVHVMTPKSRQKYRLEDVWKKPAAQGGFEDLEIA